MGLRVADGGSANLIQTRIVYQETLLEAIATNLTVALPVDLGLSAGTIRLFTNDFQPTPNSLLVDFTEATFPGYAGVAMPTLSVGLNSAGRWEMFGQSNAIFAQNGAGSETVHGWYVENAGGQMSVAERFDDPVLFTGQGDYLVLVYRMVLALSSLVP